MRGGMRESHEEIYQGGNNIMTYNPQGPQTMPPLIDVSNNPALGKALATLTLLGPGGLIGITNPYTGTGDPVREAVKLLSSEARTVSMIRPRSRVFRPAHKIDVWNGYIAETKAMHQATNPRQEITALAIVTALTSLCCVDMRHSRYAQLSTDSELITEVIPSPHMVMLHLVRWLGYREAMLFMQEFGGVSSEDAAVYTAARELHQHLDSILASVRPSGARLRPSPAQGKALDLIMSYVTRKASTAAKQRREARKGG